MNAHPQSSQRWLCSPIAVGGNRVLMLGACLSWKALLLVPLRTSHHVKHVDAPPKEFLS
jgi:hypothetical protein